MKKFLSMLLALTLVLFAFTAVAETVNPDDIPDEIVAEDGKYELAFVTDVGQLKDKSFNQGTWNGVKAYAAANGLTYKYYQPANGDQATDDDRYDAMKAACEGGAKVVVCAGFLQEAALRQAAETYPVTMGDLDTTQLADGVTAAVLEDGRTVELRYESTGRDDEWVSKLGLAADGRYTAANEWSGVFTLTIQK